MTAASASAGMSGIVAPWSASLWQRLGRFRHSSGIVEGSAQQHLDLGVEAAELVSRPVGQGVVDGGINPEQYLLAFIHWLRIEGAGVDDWCSWLVTAEHDHQVADHGRLAFFV